jgi:hypothetical protein
MQRVRRSGVSLGLALAALGGPDLAHAGCRVTFTGHYASPIGGAQRDYFLAVDLPGETRTTPGPWTAHPPRPVTLAQRGAAFSRTAELALGCDRRRQHRVRVRAYERVMGGRWMQPKAGEAWLYYPSERGWTGDTTIDLGDLARLFTLP